MEKEPYDHHQSTCDHHRIIPGGNNFHRQDGGVLFHLRDTVSTRLISLGTKIGKQSRNKTTFIRELHKQLLAEPLHHLPNRKNWKPMHCLQSRLLWLYEEKHPSLLSPSHSPFLSP